MWEVQWNIWSPTNLQDKLAAILLKWKSVTLKLEIWALLSEWCHFRIELMDALKWLSYSTALDSQSCVPSCRSVCILHGDTRTRRVEDRYKRWQNCQMKIPRDRFSWDLESTLILYPSSNDQEIQEKWQVLYLQNWWKSHCNNQWMQNHRTDLRFQLFPPWFYIKVKKDSFVQIQEGWRAGSTPARWCSDLRPELVMGRGAEGAQSSRQEP